MTTPKVALIAERAFSHATFAEASGNLYAAETTVQRLLKAEPDAPRSQRDLCVSYTKVGDVLSAQGDLTNALKSVARHIVKSGCQQAVRQEAADAVGAAGRTLLLQTRTKVLNNELEDVFRRWYPQFHARAA